MTNNMKDKLFLGVVVLLLISCAFLFGRKKEVTIGSAPSGIPATVATTSSITMAALQVLPLVGTTTGSGCSSRIVTTQAGYLELTFSDYAGQSPSATFGVYQGASTTVAYDSGLYGCGLLKAYSSAAQVITVIRTN